MEKLMDMKKYCHVAHRTFGGNPHSRPQKWISSKVDFLIQMYEEKVIFYLTDKDKMSKKNFSPTYNKVKFSSQNLIMNIFIQNFRLQCPEPPKNIIQS
jgi:hypothetical protein